MLQETQQFYDFGEFRFLPDEKLLLRLGQPVPLPPKAVDTLLVLLERHGHVVLKEDLLQRVWPDTFVEDGNLTQQISLLRKAFADGGEAQDYIETIPRRGYRFVGTVTRAADDVMVMRERTRTQIVLEERAGETRALPRVARSRVWIWLAALGAVLAAGAGGAYWFTASRAALPFEKRDWVLVLDFENQTGDARFDYALASAFTVGIEQSRHVNLYSRARAAGALRRMGKPPETRLTEELGAEVARRDGIRALVACSIARAGQQYALSARLLDPQRRVAVRSFTERAANEDQLLDALDTLARKVRQSLGESLYSISQASRPLPQVTTSSFAALQAFVEGSRAWNSGRFKEGVAGYQRAVELDPGFALAHAELASAYSSHVLQESKLSREHFEKALSATGRTTEREHLLIKTQYHSAIGHHEDAIQTYEVYLKSYPDDPVAQFNRALALMRLQRYPESIAGFQEVLRIVPQQAGALLNIATCLNSQDRDADSIPYYERAFALEPAWKTVANLNHEHGFALAGAGEPAKARESFSAALAKADTQATALRSLALLDMYEGKYRDAEQKLRESQRVSPGSLFSLRRARNHLYLALLREGRGDRAGQLRELDAAAAALKEKEPSAVFAMRTAALYARAGAVEKAIRLVEPVRGTVDEKNAEVSSEFHHTQGEIELARGNPEKALEELQAAVRAQPSPWTLEAVAHAYQKMNRAPEAVEAGEKFLAAPGFLGWEPQQAWLETHVALAEVYAQRGEKQKAAALLDKFLALWKEADADLPLLRRARELRKQVAP